MPPKSIYLSEETIQEIENRIDDSQSFSEWIQMAIQRELEGEYDELEELSEDIERLSKEVQAIQKWRTEVMDEVVAWFTGEFGPAN